MDKELVIDGATVALEVFGVGPVAGVAKGWIAYRYRRQLLTAKEGLEQLFQFISMRRRNENRDASDAAIVTFFEEHEIAIEFVDDMVSKLLNTPNETTRPIVVWVYSRHIHYLEKPSRIATRLIRLLLDCDEEELATLKDLAMNMKLRWHGGIKRSFIRVNLEEQEMIPTVYMSVAEDIEQVMRVFDKNDENKWKKWSPGEYNYSAIIDMLKRFGVSRETPILTSGTANTKTQMYLKKEAAMLLFDAFSCPEL